MMRLALISSLLLAVALNACQLDTRPGVGSGGNPITNCGDGGILCDSGLPTSAGNVPQPGGESAAGQSGTGMVIVGNAGGMSGGPDVGPPPAPKKLDGQACTTDVDCVSGHCSANVCCASGDCCKAPSDCPNMIVNGIQLACNAPSKCEGSGGRVLCTNFRCVAMGGEPNDMACTAKHQAKDCSPYKPVFCNGTQEQTEPQCPSSCKSDMDCSTGAHCDMFGACVKDVTDGGLCSMDKDCVSRHCKNRVCCKGGDCCLTADVCTSYNAPGKCTEVSTCTGVRKVAACNNNQCESEDEPDPLACVGKLVKDCGLYQDAICNNRSTPTCQTSCMTDTHCKPNAYCEMNGGTRGECKPRREDGEKCTANAQCKTKCNKGFCCNDSDPNSYCCGSTADCVMLNKAECARSDNTCDGVVSNATCTSEHRCRVTTMPDANACKRDLSCGAGYVRAMPCPLGCYCTNPLDCTDGYRCSEPATGRGKCVPDTGMGMGGMSGGPAAGAPAP